MEVACYVGILRSLRDMGWDVVGYAGASGSKDCQLASGSALKAFIYNGLTTSADILSYKQTTRMLNAFCSWMLYPQSVGLSEPRG